MPNVGPYIYTTLAFLALLGAPYIYEISSLRVKKDDNATDLNCIKQIRTVTPVLCQKKKEKCIYKKCHMHANTWEEVM